MNKFSKLKKGSFSESSCYRGFVTGVCYRGFTPVTINDKCLVFWEIFRQTFVNFLHRIRNRVSLVVRGYANNNIYFFISKSHHKFFP